MEVRVYLTNLAQYNAGRLIGKWISLPMDEEELACEIKEVLGSDEEFFITDYEADFRIEEYENLNELNSFAEKLIDLDEYDQKKVLYLVDDIGYSWEDSLEKYEDVIFYPNSTLEDVAEEMVEEGIFGDLTDQIKGYLDYEKLGRDLGIDGYHETNNGTFCYH